MNTQELLNDFQQQLVRRGLPIDYARNAAAELADHHRDLVEELCSTGMKRAVAESTAAERLGETSQLVKKTVGEFQRRHWSGRCRWLTFLVGPIPLLIAGWLTTVIVSFLVAWPLERLGTFAPDKPDGVISSGEALIQRAMQLWYLYLVPALVIFFLFRVSRQAGMGRLWICLSAVVMTLFVGLFRCDVTSFQCGAPIDRVFVVSGFPFIESWSSICLWYTADAWQIAQNLLPLILAGLLIARARLLVENSMQKANLGC